ncbi:MAG: cation-translocating P-type ATPase [Clostridia bacterium]|nr:cation-translocating P-type ATPase [Clostridia bacterium]MDD4386684.1 cation-translocating P-type ATPase [Clostridia bacterium]
MEKWYTLSHEEVINKLNSNKEGLSNIEAKKRLIQNGYNKLKESKKRGIVLKFVDQFKNVMIIVLVIAAILSSIVSYIENEPLIDTVIILVVVILNAILGVVQESKAEKAIEALKSMSLPYIKVKRDGNVLSVKVEELVIGDIVLIEAGDYVPADMRITESHSLKIEESSLTGESVPVDKSEDTLKTDSDIALGDRINMLYSGSSCVYGRGDGIVTDVGMNTELGKIAQAISGIDSEETPLQQKMRELSKMISILVVSIAFIMIVVGIIQGRPILDVFMLAIALAVAAIPEGLAAVITITLAVGVQKMAREKSIIRKLSAVEALGSTEVICSDKTGTLTQNKMTVRKIYVDNKLIDVTNDDNLGELNIDVFSRIFTLCNDTRLGEDNGYKVLLGDPTETALISFAERINIDKEQYEKMYKRIEEVPFDSTRKMMCTVNEVGGKYMICVKGAIESVIKNSKYILINGEVKNLTDNMKNNILTENLNLARSALRVLGFAYKYEETKLIVKKLDDMKKLESDLIFVGMTGMIDPPRPEAKEAVKQCFEAGMIPVMITGDNIDTAVSIAIELGILTDFSQAVKGLDVDAMSDDELMEKVENIRVYARVSPENKIRIIKAWKKIGKTVAMTGDGVNDAPALKGADIGIGMGITGTEVSKSVSSMILADDNFSTIVVAVKEGRRIYTNIQNVIVYLLASNLAEILIIFFATLMDKTLLLPIQILWINLVTDTIPAIALGFEKGQPGIMKQKPRKKTEKFFNPFLTSRIVIPAVLKSIIIFVLYIIVEKSHGAIIASGAVFVTLATIEILFSFICRSDRQPIYKIGFFSNKYMMICVVATLIIQYTMLMIPMTREWLKVDSIPVDVYMLILFVSLISIIIFELIKLVLAKIYIKEDI